MTYAIKYFPHTQHFDKYVPSKMDNFTRKQLSQISKKKALIIFKRHIVFKKMYRILLPIVSLWRHVHIPAHIFFSNRFLEK